MHALCPHPYVLRCSSTSGFNHVQHEFVLTEVEDLHRGETSPITARAAYAGSKTVGDKGAQQNVKRRVSVRGCAVRFT